MRRDGPRVAVWLAYAVLGATLLWSRLAYLGHSFWTDEILMIENYVRGGPSRILAGPGLSHELMALLSWVVSSAVGESEIALRLLSVVPFVAGVILVTAWLHARLGAVSGVLFLFLATVSPLLLDITRQARGYGLAFLAMSVLVVSALEVTSTRDVGAFVAFCAAGIVGTWTLPQFGLAFVATGCVVVAAYDRRRRPIPVAGLAASIVAIVVWYAPHLGGVESASRIEDGVQIGFPWVITAPIDQVLLPALLWIDGTALVAGLVWLPLVLVAAVVAGASPLLRERSAALVLSAGVTVTVVALWVTQSYVIPRYLSFLLVPLFVAVATGAASILGRPPQRRVLVQTLVCLVVIALLVARFVALAPDVVGLPREANRDAAAVIARHKPAIPVLAYMRNPQNLVFYLERPVAELESGDVAAAVCGRATPVFYVFQDFALEDVSVPCLDRAGVGHERFRQYARGEMNVWLVPPRQAPDE